MMKGNRYLNISCYVSHRTNQINRFPFQKTVYHFFFQLSVIATNKAREFEFANFTYFVVPYKK